jgi:hypothetical protein
MGKVHGKGLGVAPFTHLPIYPFTLCPMPHTLRTLLSSGHNFKNRTKKNPAKQPGVIKDRDLCTVGALLSGSYVPSKEACNSRNRAGLPFH